MSINSSSASVVVGDRITKVSLGNFDQAFVLTQYLINNALDNLWCADRNSDNPSTANFDIQDPSTVNHMRKVTVSTPRIILQPWNPVPGIGAVPVPIIFQMTFESGNLNVVDTTLRDAAGNPLTDGNVRVYDLTGWKIAYKTTLMPRRIDPTSPKYRDMVRKLPAAGNYNITSLYPGLSSPTNAAYFANPDLTLTSFGPFMDDFLKSSSMMTGFGTLIALKLVDLLNHDLLSAAYLTSTNNPSSISPSNHPPTFVPTHNAQQGYPWIGPDPISQPSFGLQGNSRMNCLCSLAMTDNRSPPFDESIPVNGNWTTTTPPTAATSTPLSRTGWTATADNPQQGYDANNVLDQNIGSIWHTAFSSPSAPQYPHSITIDMKAYNLVSGLTYLPRQDGSLNGTIGKYAIEYSTNGTSFQPITKGYWSNDHSLKQILFPPVLAQYVRLNAYSESQGTGNPWASASEINLLSNGLPRSKWGLGVDSAEPGFDASKMEDGNLNTFWHTRYNGAAPAHPHWIQFQTPTPGGNIGLVSGLSYVPRQDGIPNGNIGSYRVEASRGNGVWFPLTSGTWADDSSVKTVTFSPIDVPWLRLVALSEAGGRGPWTSAAEVNLLDATGQVANQSSSDFGSFIMSKNNFFERYLLPKLSVFNSAFEAYSGLPKLETHMDGIYAKFSWEAPDLGIGTHANSNTDFSFKATTASTTAGKRWAFHSAYHYPSGDDYQSVEGNKFIGNEIQSKVKCDTDTAVWYNANTSRITVDGTTSVTINLDITASHVDEWKRDEVKFTYGWTMYLDLQSVSDGGLAINVTRVYDPTKETEEYHKDRNPVDSPGSLHILSQYPSHLRACFQAAKTRFGALEDQLQQDFSGQQKFYFPASGTYFFKNPVFNNNGDLLCSVSYNGTDELLPNPDAPDRKRIDQGTVAPIPAALGAINA